MKTRAYIATFAASLFVCGLGNAQVLGGAGSLGGELRGGLGGATSGGLRNPSGMIHGRGEGSFGGGLDVSGVRRTTSEVGARASQRAQGAARSVGNRARDTAAAASATAASSAAAQGQGRSSAVMGDIGGSLEGGASLVKQPQVPAPTTPVPASEATPSGMLQPSSPTLDMGASKQQAIAVGANREAQLMGQGEGALTGSAGGKGVSASAQGSSSAAASWQRPASEPAR